MPGPQRGGKKHKQNKTNKPYHKCRKGNKEGDMAWPDQRHQNLKVLQKVLESSGDALEPLEGSFQRANCFVCTHTHYPCAPGREAHHHLRAVQHGCGATTVGA